MVFIHSSEVNSNVGESSYEERNDSKKTAAFSKWLALILNLANT